MFSKEVIVTHPNLKSGSIELAKLLATMNEQGGFPIAVLTDRHGFPIASATRPAAAQDPETQSAVVALIQKTAVQVRDQLGMAQTDDISLAAADGQRVGCRPFKVNGHDLILAVLVPGKARSYRRLTSQTVTAIRRLWKL